MENEIFIPKKAQEEQKNHSGIEEQKTPSEESQGNIGTPNVRKNSSLEHKYSSRQLKPVENDPINSLKISQETWDTIIDKVKVNLKNPRQFSFDNFKSLFNGAKADRNIYQNLLARVLANISFQEPLESNTSNQKSKKTKTSNQETEQTNSANQELQKKSPSEKLHEDLMKKYKNEFTSTLIYRLRGILQSMIAEEKAKQSNKSNPTPEKTTISNDSKQEVTQVSTANNQKQADQKSQVTTEKSLVSNKQEIVQVSTITDQKQIVQKTPLPVAIKQSGAERTLENLHNILWALDFLAILLVIKHIKDPLREIKALSAQFHIITEFLGHPVLDKDSKLITTPEAQEILTAFLKQAIKIAKTYIKNAVKETKKNMMDVVPDGVRDSTTSIAMSALIEYAKNPTQTSQVINHSLLAADDQTTDLDIPTKIPAEVIKTITALQLDHGLYEDYKNFLKDSTTLFYKKKNASTYIFENTAIKYDLTRVIYSLRFILYFQSTLDKGTEKQLIANLLTDVTKKTIERMADTYTVLLAMAEKKQNDLANDFTTIHKVLSQCKNNPETLQEKDLDNLKTALSHLITIENEIPKNFEKTFAAMAKAVTTSINHNSQEYKKFGALEKALFNLISVNPQKAENLKEFFLRFFAAKSEDAVKILNNIFKCKSAEDFLEKEKTIISPLKELLNSKELLSDYEMVLRTQIQELYQKAPSKYEKLLKENPNKVIEKIGEKLLISIMSYTDKKIAPKLRSQITNPHFIKFAADASKVSMRKKLSKKDMQIIEATLRIGPEDLKTFSNPALGRAIYQAFMEAIPLTAEDFAELQVKINSQNYSTLNLSNNDLGLELREILKNHKPDKGDRVKICKYLPKRQLDKLNKLSDKYLAAELYRALVKAIGFTKADAEILINCLETKKIDDFQQISKSNPILGPALSKAVEENSFLLSKDVAAICENLDKKNFNELKDCELGPELHYLLFKTVLPNEEDKKILGKIKKFLKNQPQQDEKVEESAKINILKMFNKFSNKVVVEKLRETSFSPRQLKEVLSSLTNYSPDFEFELKQKGPLGEGIYKALIDSMSLHSENVQIIRTSLETKTPEALEQLNQISNKLLGNEIYKLVKNYISCSKSDIKKTRNIFIDQYEDLQFISYRELGTILYQLFTDKQPILTDKDIKSILAGLTGDLEKFLEIADEAFGKLLNDKVQTSTVSKTDRIAIFQNILSGEVAKLKDISNKPFGESLYNALHNLQLSEQFDFSLLQRLIIALIVTAPTKLLSFLDSQNKKKQEEKPLINPDRLTEVLQAFGAQSDADFRANLMQIVDAPIPKLLKKFVQNILDQLTELFTDTGNEFCHQLQKLLHSPVFLLTPFHVLQEKLHISEAKESIVILSKLNQHVQQLTILSKDLDILFAGNNFFEDYDKLSSSSKTLLMQHMQSNIFYNYYNSFILLNLFKISDLKKRNFKVIALNSYDNGRMILEPFTYEALVRGFGMSESELPLFMKSPKNPILSELLKVIAPLGLKNVIGYAENGTPVKKPYPEALKDVFFGLTGLHTKKFDPNNTFHLYLARYCRATTQKSHSLETQTSFGQSKDDSKRMVSVERRATTFSQQIGSAILECAKKINKNDLHGKSQLKEYLFVALSFAIADTHLQNIRTFTLHCIAKGASKALEVAYTSQFLTTQLDGNALNLAIENEDVPKVKKLLKAAGKFDVTILYCQKTISPLIDAYRACKQDTWKPMIRTILDHLTVNTQQPFVVVEFLWDFQKKQKHHYGEENVIGKDEKQIEDEKQEKEDEKKEAEIKVMIQEALEKFGFAKVKKQKVSSSEKTPSSNSNSDSSSSLEELIAAFSNLIAISSKEETNYINLLKLDNEANFLINYAENLAKKYTYTDDPKGNSTSPDSDKFVLNLLFATKVIAKNLTPEIRHSFLLKLIAAVHSSQLYDMKSLTDLIDSIKESNVDVLDVLLTKKEPLTFEQRRQVIELFDLSNRATTLRLKNYVIDLKQPNLRLQEMLETIAENQLMNTDCDEFVIKILIAELKKLSPKLLTSNKWQIQSLMGQYEKKIAPFHGGKKSFQPSYLEHAKKSTSQLVDEMIKGATLIVPIRIEICCKDNITEFSTSLKKYTTELYKSPSISWSNVVDILVIIWEKRIKQANGKFLIEEFIGDIKDALKRQVIPNSGQETLNDTLTKKILEPYNKEMAAETKFNAVILKR